MLRYLYFCRADESGSSGIVLENVNSRSLTKVLEYCTVHCTPPPGTTEADLKVWDSKFVKVEPSILCELASVCHAICLVKLTQC